VWESIRLAGNCYLLRVHQKVDAFTMINQVFHQLNNSTMIIIFKKVNNFKNLGRMFPTRIYIYMIKLDYLM